jgi:hypothetical protein
VMLHKVVRMCATLFSTSVDAELGLFALLHRLGFILGDSDINKWVQKSGNIVLFWVFREPKKDLCCFYFGTCKT